MLLYICANLLEVSVWFMHVKKIKQSLANSPTYACRAWSRGCLCCMGMSRGASYSKYFRQGCCCLGQHRVDILLGIAMVFGSVDLVLTYGECQSLSWSWPLTKWDEAWMLGGCFGLSTPWFWETLGWSFLVMVLDQVV